MSRMGDMLIDQLFALAALALKTRGFRSRYANTAHGRVHYYELSGSGLRPPLVLLHGIGSSALAFAKVAPLLAPSFQKLILPELPGHGLSDVPGDWLQGTALFEGMSSALEVAMPEPFYFMGNSLGGMAVLRYAANAPKRLLGAVVCSPGGAQMSPETLQEVLSAFDTSTHAKGRKLVERLFAGPPRYAHLSTFLIRQMVGRPPIRELMKHISTDALLSPDELARIRVPLLFLWGKQEKLLPIAHRDYFLANLPPHVVTQFPEGYGHLPQIENSKDLSRRIVEFIDEQRARANGAAA